MNNRDKTMDQIIALCKNRGFVFLAAKFTAVSQLLGLRPSGRWNLKNNVKKPG